MIIQREMGVCWSPESWRRSVRTPLPGDSRRIERRSSAPKSNTVKIQPVVVVDSAVERVVEVRRNSRSAATMNSRGIAHDERLLRHHVRPCGATAGGAGITAHKARP